MCKLCAEKIYAFYEFRLSYLESEKKLREMLQNYEYNQRQTASCSDPNPVSGDVYTNAQPNFITKSTQAEAANSFECHECGRRFERELELRIHSHTHRKIDTPSQNNDSHNGFDDQLLIAHIKSEPIEYAAYDFNPLDWPDISQSDVDNPFHDDDDDVADDLRWKCTICDQRFLRRAHLRAHRREHAVDRPGKSTEKKSIDDYRKPTITIPILATKHDKGNLHLFKKKDNLNLSADAQFERWQCKKCFSTFRTRRLLRDHNVVHRNATVTTLDLESILNAAVSVNETSSLIGYDIDGNEDTNASKGPPTTKKLNASSPKSHSTPNARWKCSKCRKVFETPKALRKHKQTNHRFEIKLNLKSKNFVSDKKNASFDTATKKKSLIATSAAAAVADAAAAATADAVDAAAAAAAAAARSPFVERDWPCNSCHQVFNRRSALREHRRTVHMLKPTALPISMKQEQMDIFSAEEYAMAE